MEDVPNDDDLHGGEDTIRAAMGKALTREDRLHLARCGIMGKPYVDALERSGVLRETAVLLVAKIRKGSGCGLPGGVELL